MKKLLVAMLLLAGTGSIGTNSFASDCKNVDFDNGNVCVNIEKVSGETFRLTTDTSNGILRCGVLLADKPYKDVACNGGTFSVNDLDTQLIKIFIKQGSEVPSDWEDKPSTASKWLFPQWNYDFDNEEWEDSGSSSSSSNGDVEDFTITLADSTPSEDEEVKLTIKAIDSSDDTVTDYDGANAEITVEYRTSSSSSWKDATSSYVSIDDETPTFSNGSAYTYITFKSDYDYRITVTDQDDDSINTPKTIYIDSSSSSSSNGDFSSSELRTIKNLYSTWNSSISELESGSYKLRNNTTRQNMSDDLYDEMKKIIDDDSDKLYDNMDEFETAFNKRYKYTTQND